ncbi:type II secretion system major pseudopilin GspG [Burkholderia sp. Ac-20353]|uniref:type II secretion system major pseudopilin GspG n=1 Tax=Burkholderia sp. Ac-20353 TaxID=2703894 RepID=UPI00197B6B69|nr:type II secretion system major pseudopilin GspG [Burkholderia sp. Ac-20353]MBN3788941.1 type II secretion system major pseudopilin GspG [Burkholderia sp. Ac-20353]
MKFVRDSVGNETAGHEPSGPSARAKGFTLLELLVVIVIIGLLASYVGPRYFSQVNKSQTTLAKAQLASFEKALDAFRLDVGRYPTTEEGLNALMVEPANVANWNGPYLKKEIPPDPWGRPYQYRVPGPKGEFEVKTLGKSGVPGGTGESPEISIP